MSTQLVQIKMYKHYMILDQAKNGRNASMYTELRTAVMANNRRAASYRE